MLGAITLEMLGDGRGGRVAVNGQGDLRGRLGLNQDETGQRGGLVGIHDDLRMGRTGLDLLEVVPVGLTQPVGGRGVGGRQGRADV